MNGGGPGKPAYVTASGLGEFAYCRKKWALAQKYGKLSREELQERAEALKTSGQEGSAEYALYQRMLSAQGRMDAGTTAHTDHAQAAASGRDAASTSWILAAAAVGIAAMAVYFMSRG